MGKTRRPQSTARLHRLDAESVAADFGAGSELAREGVFAFADVLESSDSPEVAAARRQWLAGLQGTFGTDLRRLDSGLDALAAEQATGRHRDPLALLFAVQTYYVLIVKLLAWQIAARARRSDTLSQIARGATHSEMLRQFAQDLESDGVGAVLVGETGFGDPHAWYLRAWSDSMDAWLRRALEAWQRYDFRSAIEAMSGEADLLRTLYQRTFPKRLRHVLGEYYTPGWLVEQMLDDAGYVPDAAAGLLDPACGSGAFLVAAIRRLRTQWTERGHGRQSDREALCRAILSDVVGIDLNPLAVVTARANYLTAISDLLPHAGRVEVPVHLGDSILGRHPELRDYQERFDFVVGNPPWIAWDDLPSSVRQATGPLWRHYGLFTLSGSEARHGGGKKDLSMLMIYAAADRYLKPSGRLAMVVTQTIFQTRGAGDGFRRFRLGEAGQWLRVLRVRDLVEAKPFAATANWTATLVLEKGCPTIYPVPYTKYSSDRARREFDAVPIDPNRPTSPWMLWPCGSHRSAAAWIGPSDYKAHLGANTGGANGVYWLTLCDDSPPAQAGLVRVRNIAERGKRAVMAGEWLVEPELVYPLLRWSNVGRFRAVPKAHLLLAQDPQTRRGIAESVMRERYPQAYAYLSEFRDVLERRAAYRRYQSRASFYSMYDVGPYTVAPIKVVWRRMDRRVNAAVVESIEHTGLGLRPVIPQETCVLVAVDSAQEAHYLCALLNSSLLNFLVASHNVRGGKSFGSPGILDFLAIRRYSAGNPLHRELAAASREAHDVVAAGGDAAAIQQRIDRLSERLRGIERSPPPGYERQVCR